MAGELILLASALLHLSLGLPSYSSERSAYICTLPVNSGLCKKYSPRYAYNGEACIEFVYGGCGGNGNNFETEEECERACQSTYDELTLTVQRNVDIDIPVCQRPITVGPCRAFSKRWAMNKQGECQSFLYGGCRGNENNFLTEEDCKRTCEGKEGNSSPDMQRRGLMGGLDVCKQPVKSGPCYASIQRWGMKNGVCQQFTYGGCGGNENNFGSEFECNQACPTRNPTSRTIEPWQTGLERCTLPTVRGPCRSFTKQWTMDLRANKCKRFLYGGCGGNANRFETKEECESICQRNGNLITSNQQTRELNGYDTTPSRCQQPLKRGHCMHLVKKWGMLNGKCLEFIYGGCEGNDNRFDTKEECERECKVEKDDSSPRLLARMLDGVQSEVCLWDPPTGVCQKRQSEERTGYAYINGRCQLRKLCFDMYSPANAFRSREECETACSGH